MAGSGILPSASSQTSESTMLVDDPLQSSNRFIPIPERLPFSTTSSPAYLRDDRLERGEGASGTSPDQNRNATNSNSTIAGNLGRIFQRFGDMRQPKPVDDTVLPMVQRQEQSISIQNAKRVVEFDDGGNAKSVVRLVNADEKAQKVAEEHYQQKIAQYQTQIESLQTPFYQNELQVQRTGYEISAAQVSENQRLINKLREDLVAKEGEAAHLHQAAQELQQQNERQQRELREQQAVDNASIMELQGRLKANEDQNAIMISDMLKKLEAMEKQRVEDERRNRENDSAIMKRMEDMRHKDIEEEKQRMRGGRRDSVLSKVNHDECLRQNQSPGASYIPAVSRDAMVVDDEHPQMIDPDPQRLVQVPSAALRNDVSFASQKSDSANAQQVVPAKSRQVAHAQLRSRLSPPPGCSSGWPQRSSKDRSRTSFTILDPSSSSRQYRGVPLAQSAMSSSHPNQSNRRDLAPPPQSPARLSSPSGVHTKLVLVAPPSIPISKSTSSRRHVLPPESDVGRCPSPALSHGSRPWSPPRSSSPHETLQAIDAKILELRRLEEKLGRAKGSKGKERAHSLARPQDPGNEDLLDTMVRRLKRAEDRTNGQVAIETESDEEDGVGDEKSDDEHSTAQKKVHRKHTRFISNIFKCILGVASEKDFRLHEAADEDEVRQFNDSEGRDGGPSNDAALVRFDMLPGALMSRWNVVCAHTLLKDAHAILREKDVKVPKHPLPIEEYLELFFKKLKRCKVRWNEAQSRRLDDGAFENVEDICRRLDRKDDVDLAIARATTRRITKHRNRIRICKRKIDLCSGDENPRRDQLAFWYFFLLLLRLLGPGGNSSDATEIDEETKEKVYRVKIMFWRRDMQHYLNLIDSHRKDSSYFSTRGSTGVRRLSETKYLTRREPKKGLPRELYDDEWFEEIDAERRAMWMNVSKDDFEWLDVCNTVSLDDGQDLDIVDWENPPSDGED